MKCGICIRVLYPDIIYKKIYELLSQNIITVSEVHSMTHCGVLDEHCNACISIRIRLCYYCNIVTCSSLHPSDFSNTVQD